MPVNRRRGLYFYAGRTARGLGWIGFALSALIVVTVGFGLFLLVLVAALGPGIRQSQLPEPYMTAAMTAGFAYVLAQIVLGAAFVAGFVKLYNGSKEFGEAHSSRMDLALVFFLATAAAAYASNALPSTGTTPTPSFASPAPSTLQAFLGPLLGGLAALLAGVSLFLAVRTFASLAERRRLGVATALGVAGGAGRQVLMLLGTIGPSSPDTLPLAVVSVAVMGSAVSAASLALFVLVFRGIRGRIESGAYPPSVPRGPWELPGQPVAYAVQPPPPPTPPAR